MTEGSVITTVEGLIEKIIDNLQTNSAIYTDSDDKFSKFINQMNKYLNLEDKFTLILDDPLGYSFIWDDLTQTDNIKIETYTRTPEQDDEYGIN